MYSMHTVSELVDIPVCLHSPTVAVSTPLLKPTCHNATLNQIGMLLLLLADVGYNLHLEALL